MPRSRVETACVWVSNRRSHEKVSSPRLTNPLDPSIVASRTSASTAWVVVCIVWGTTYLGIRIALETVPPFLMASFRWLMAGTLLTGGLMARGVKLPSRASWPSYALVGVLMNGVGNGGVVWAEQTVPSGLTAVLVAAIPFWMVGTERFMFDGGPITGRRIAGLILGFLGIVLLVWPAHRRRRPFVSPGRFGDSDRVFGLGDWIEHVTQESAHRQHPGRVGVAD